MARRSNPKNLTAAEKRLDAKMAATTMRFKRYKEIQKRVMAVAKRVNAMPKHPRASALITWELMTGKKDLRTLLDSMGYSPQACDELVPLLEAVIEELHETPLFEMTEDDDLTPIMFDCEPILLEMSSLASEYESPVYTGRLSVKRLNLELKEALKGGKKVTRPDHKPTKDEQLKTYFDLFSKLYTKLEEKLPEYGITPTPEAIERTILKMTEWVSRLRVKKKEAGVAKPKGKVAAVPA